MNNQNPGGFTSPGPYSQPGEGSPFPMGPQNPYPNQENPYPNQPNPYPNQPNPYPQGANYASQHLPNQGQVYNPYPNQPQNVGYG